MKARNVDFHKIKTLLSYNPDTGNFHWISNSGRYGRIKYGSVAGTLSKRHGYIEIHVLNVLIKAHRLAWFFMTGQQPTDEIDHINRKRNDNRWINLRAVTKSQNLMNKNTYKNNTSGSPGVTWHKRQLMWQVRIGCNGKRIHLGYFHEKEKADIAYKSAKLEFHKIEV